MSLFKKVFVLIFELIFSISKYKEIKLKSISMRKIKNHASNENQTSIDFGYVSAHEVTTLFIIEMLSGAVMGCHNGFNKKYILIIVAM